MLSLKLFNFHLQAQIPLLKPPTHLKPSAILHQGYSGKINVKGRRLAVVGCAKEERKGFLSLEEAGLVEISGLSTHERFLCRLTISSLNLLRVISEQEGLPIKELNAGRICDWFLKDKLKREQDLNSAVLRWDDSDFPI